jgi:phosphoribosylanthranilate isomerase
MVQTCPKVKVCGITSLADAALATELGAWALGMIFYEGSPRRCSEEEARRIATALRRDVELCGVFVNAPLHEVLQRSEELGLSMVQLHGEEGPSYCGEVRRRTGARIIKAAQVSGPGDVRDLERFHVDFHLLDARSQAPDGQRLRGGTGETFDWGLLAVRRSKIPLILSGGLHAGNVAEAVAVADPYAVDTASGTEAAPGRKDPQRLRAFFEAVAGCADATEEDRQGEVEQVDVEQATVERTKAERAAVEQATVEQAKVEQAKVERTKVEQAKVGQSA